MSKLRHVIYNHVCILDESQSGVPYLKMRQISLKEIFMLFPKRKLQKGLDGGRDGLLSVL